MLNFYLVLGLKSGFFLSDFPINILYAFTFLRYLQTACKQLLIKDNLM